jgi:large conductance mechanosensitive channel
VLKGFKEFIARGNVVDLAVAVVVGTAFTALVASLVTNLFTPLIGAIFGVHNFDDLTFTLHGSVFYYGKFLNALIAFLSVAAVVYFLVVLPLNLLAERRARGAGPAPEEMSDEVRLLSEIRDLLAGREPAGGGEPAA